MLNKTNLLGSKKSFGTLTIDLTIDDGHISFGHVNTVNGKVNLEKGSVYTFNNVDLVESITSGSGKLLNVYLESAWNESKYSYENASIYRYGVNIVRAEFCVIDKSKDAYIKLIK